MIISASYKTDIPAFYGEWFINRLRAGSCKMVNPYGGQVYTIALKPEAVDGFVFWTRNAAPFLPALAEVHQRPTPFVVQYGITGYPRALERSVVHPARAVEVCRRLAGLYGPRAVVWRYDTIVISSLTPVEFHLRNFAQLAQSMEGICDEVVISFAQIYRKTLRNMNAAAREFNFTWEDPGDDVKRALATQLVPIARSRGMQLSVCSQRNYIVDGAADARCIDARRLEDLAGRQIRVSPRGHRPECGCYASKDIGEYDTCPHGCVYCYAVSSHATAVARFKQHDPASEFLFAPKSIRREESAHPPS